MPTPPFDPHPVLDAEYELCAATDKVRGDKNEVVIEVADLNVVVAFADRLLPEDFFLDKVTKRNKRIRVDRVMLGQYLKSIEPELIKLDREIRYVNVKGKSNASSDSVKVHP